MADSTNSATASAFGGASTAGDDSCYAASVDSSPDLCPTAATVPPTPADGVVPTESPAGLSYSQRLPAFRDFASSATLPPKMPAHTQQDPKARSVSIGRPRLVTEPDRMPTAELQRYIANVRNGMLLLKPGAAAHARLAARLERFEAELVRRRFPGWVTPLSSVEGRYNTMGAGHSQADGEDGDPLMPSACPSSADSWHAQQ